jgi:hypothetical protein
VRSDRQIEQATPSLCPVLATSKQRPAGRRPGTGHRFYGRLARGRGAPDHRQPVPFQVRDFPIRQLVRTLARLQGRHPPTDRAFGLRRIAETDPLPPAAQME